MNNPIAHPPHYTFGKIEVIEAIEDWQLGFHRGNAVKYIARAGKKDASREIEDLEKARWYISREIECLKAKSENKNPIRPNDMTKATPVDTSATAASGSEIIGPLTDTAEIVPKNLVKLEGYWIRAGEIDEVGCNYLVFSPDWPVLAEDRTPACIWAEEE